MCALRHKQRNSRIVENFFSATFLHCSLCQLAGVKNVGTWKNTLFGAEAFSDAVVEVACECRWKSRNFSLLTLSQSRTNNLKFNSDTNTQMRGRVVGSVR